MIGDVVAFIVMLVVILKAMEYGYKARIESSRKVKLLITTSKDGRIKSIATLKEDAERIEPIFYQDEEDGEND